MKVRVVGCGHIGVINAYGFLLGGNQVSVSEIDPKKIDRIRSREPLFFERTLDWDLFYSEVQFSNFDDRSDLTIICIDLPVINGTYQISNLIELIEECCHRSRLVALRSTLSPMDASQLISEIALKPGHSLRDIIYWPEFMREGSAVDDFESDPVLVAPLSTRIQHELLSELLPRAQLLTSAETLAAIKMYSNAFRAIKLSFANSVALSCDSSRFNRDEFQRYFPVLRGNCDNLYLSSGDPFGGFCLPKELICASMNLSNRDVSSLADIFSAASKFNGHLIDRLVEIIVRNGETEVGFIGLSFKPGTSDTRNSPYKILFDQLSSAGVTCIDLSQNDVVVQAIFLRQFDNYDHINIASVYKFEDVYK